MSKDKAVTAKQTKTEIIPREAVQAETNGKLITASGRAISETEMEQIRAMVFESVGRYLPADKFELLMQPPPQHAIKYRQGGGGANYPYLKSGYVKLKLLQIFGLDRDFEVLPIDGNGAMYHLSTKDNKEVRVSTGNPTVMVYGRLTLRIHGTDKQGNPTSDVIATIRSPGFGSVEWRDKQELGDAVKGAASDALKVCAYPLGPALGLTLYWDDEAEWQNFENEQKLIAQAQQQATDRVPQTLVELISKAQSKYGYDAQQLAVKLEVENIIMVKDFAAAWAKLGGTNGNGN